jgi:site-specific recombinase XerD
MDSFIEYAIWIYLSAVGVALGSVALLLLMRGVIGILRFLPPVAKRWQPLAETTEAWFWRTVIVLVCVLLITLVAAHVTPQHVKAYMADFAVQKISSVTAWNNIYKVRRAAQLLSPDQDFSWLGEIEKDLALMMEPRSKLDRVVFAERLVEAGLTLIAEAKGRKRAEFVRARRIRNGLMVALLALCPCRPKNFATLEIGRTFRQVRSRWWIVLPARSTKIRSPEERPVPTWMNAYIDLYLNEARPVLLDPSKPPTSALWISSHSGQPMKQRDVGKLISQLTEETLGVAISPHLFRTADATPLLQQMPPATCLTSQAHCLGIRISKLLRNITTARAASTRRTSTGKLFSDTGGTPIGPRLRACTHKFTMSAIPPLATDGRPLSDVRFVPSADV